MSDFYGHPVASIENEQLRLEYLTAAGPRLVRLFLKGRSANLLAETPDMEWETAAGTFHLFGGHRLWIAPETVNSSYPDNTPPVIEHSAHQVRLVQAAEPRGLQKELSVALHAGAAALHASPVALHASPVALHAGAAALTLTHRVHNLGAEPCELALWAITQLPLGGIAILPQATAALDPQGWQPNRSLALWPYTQWNDPRLQFGDAAIQVAAQPRAEACKIGYFNRLGWIEYQHNGLRFRKHFPVVTGAPHLDFGCNVEVYVRDRFIELETLSPVVMLEPGQSHSHQETWEILPLDPA